MYSIDSSILWQRPMARMLMMALTLCIALALLGSWWSHAESPMPLSTMAQFQYASAREQGTPENGQSHPHAFLADPLGQSPMANPALVYSSYMGGDGADYGKDVAVDAAGNIYIIGQTYSDTLFDNEIERKGYSDIFVAKFDPTGSELLYWVLIGGEDSDSPLSIDVDAEGNVYGTAIVFDETFPTQNALWPTPPESTNSVLFKLDSKGEIVYSTYLPLDSFYSRQNLVVDKAGNAYVVGSAWITEGETFWRGQIILVKLSPDGSELLLNQHFGGTGTEYGTAIALDSSGNIYLAGTTSQTDDFPVTDNAHQPVCGDILYDPDTYCFEDGVVMVLNPQGEVTYASYHGGSFTDDPQAIAADGKGNFVIAGDTGSGQFPLVNAIQDSCPLDSSTGDCYSPRGYASVIHLDEEVATLAYSTYLGSTERNSNNAVLAAAMDRAGNAYVTGYTSGKKFPLANAVQDELYESFCYTFSSERYCFDGFVAKFSPKGELLMGTYLGADFDEYPYGLTLDTKGNIYLTGTTEGSEFPTTENAYEPSNLINDDAFLVKLAIPATTAPRIRPAPLRTQQLMLPAFLR